MRLGKLRFGHLRLQNDVGDGGLPLKSPQDGNRLDTPSHLLRFLYLDGRWHLAVNLGKMSSPGPDRLSQVCWSCPLLCVFFFFNSVTKPETRFLINPPSRWLAFCLRDV